MATVFKTFQTAVISLSKNLDNFHTASYSYSEGYGEYKIFVKNGRKSASFTVGLNSVDLVYTLELKFNSKSEILEINDQTTPYEIEKWLVKVIKNYDLLNNSTPSKKISVSNLLSNIVYH